MAKSKVEVVYKDVLVGSIVNLFVALLLEKFVHFCNAEVGRQIFLTRASSPGVVACSTHEGFYVVLHCFPFDSIFVDVPRSTTIFRYRHSFLEPLLCNTC